LIHGKSLRPGRNAKGCQRFEVLCTGPVGERVLPRQRGDHHHFQAEVCRQRENQTLDGALIQVLWDLNRGDVFTAHHSSPFIEGLQARVGGPCLFEALLEPQIPAGEPVMDLGEIT